MKYSIFILLFLIYALIGVICFHVVRMMKSEAVPSPSGLPGGGAGRGGSAGV